ncbi:MAG TPA: YcxB family protein [Mycetocola sp.]|nr:YcxB family protein [Mycetocola sp.]
MRLKPNWVYLALTTIVVAPSAIVTLRVTSWCFTTVRMAGCGGTPVVPLAFGIGSAWLLYLLLVTWLQLTTRLSDEGIGQRTLRGSLFIPWSEVKRVDSYGTGIIIHGEGRGLVVTAQVFLNPGDVDRFLRAHLDASIYPGEVRPAFDWQRHTLNRDSMPARGRDASSAMAGQVKLRPNWIAVLAMSFLAFPFGLAVLWMATACRLGLPNWVSCRDDAWWAILGLSALALWPIGLTVRAWLQLTTTITAEGIGQRTWRGRVFLPWARIREVRVQPQGSPIVFRADDRRIALTVPLFRNLHELDLLLQARLTEEIYPR